MKILLIYTTEEMRAPVKPLLDLDEIHFGISYISSCLRQHHHETRLLVLTRKSDFSLIDQCLADFAPKLVGFTAVASEYAFVEGISRTIKRHHPELFLLCGGVHVSLNPQDAMLEVFDAICIGEGEDAVRELAAQLEQGISPSGISNLWILRNGRIERNSPRAFLPDLDILPFPDREMWKEWIEREGALSRPSLLLGRGCPFNCSYCCNHALRKVSPGEYVRVRSPENILEELEGLLEHYPMVREVYLECENFLVRREWCLHLCAKLQDFNAKRPAAIAFGVNIRVTPRGAGEVGEIFAALRKSNFRFINIGLESGSERVRRRILRRNYSNEDVLHVVNTAKQSGLEVFFYNLVGLPFEKLEDFNQTIAMNRICLPQKIYLSIFFPYPGTDLYALCEQNHFLKGNLLKRPKERVIAALNYPEFRRRQIQKAYLWFEYYVYKDHHPTEKLARQVLNRYSQVYSDQKKYLLPLIFLRDILSPSSKFHSGYQEYRVLFAAVTFYLFKKPIRKFLTGVRRSLHFFKQPGPAKTPWKMG